MATSDDLGHLADIPMWVDVELARRSLSIAEILGLEPGKVLRFPKSAGENIDILVGGAPLGSGEVVVLEDIMGVRITDFRET